MLVIALVHSRLDYGNSDVLTGIPAYLTRRLQSVAALGLLSAAAWLIYQLRSSGHITDALVCLHWLRIPERIEYKIALLTYKVMNGMLPPTAISGTFVRVAYLPGRRALRSAVTNRLTVPAVKLSTIVAERFPFPVLKRGTNYRKKSPLRHLCLPSNVASRHSYSENHSRTLLLIDTLVDLVVILYYLSHSKNSACLFHAERR